MELFDLPVSLSVVGHSERIINLQNATHVQEELGRNLLSVIGNRVGRRTLWEHPMDDEGSGDFARRYSLQWDSTHQLVESIEDVEEMSVFSRREDQLSEYVNTH